MTQSKVRCAEIIWKVTAAKKKFREIPCVSGIFNFLLNLQTYSLMVYLQIFNCALELFFLEFKSFYPEITKGNTDSIKKTYKWWWWENIWKNPLKCFGDGALTIISTEIRYTFGVVMRQTFQTLSRYIICRGVFRTLSNI